MSSSERAFPVTRCESRKCQAQVIFAVSVKTGGRMIVDAEPVAGGTVRLEWRGGELPAAIVVSASRAFGVAGLRKAHQATCKEPGAFRRRGRR